MQDDTHDSISVDRLGGLFLQQPKEGYRFSIDSVLLADFVRPKSGPVADLGAGCGVVSVILHRKGLAGPFWAVELDGLAADCCRENFKRHGVPGSVLHHDLTRPHDELKSSGFRLAVSNPPFYAAGSGRMPAKSSRARARHELALSPGSLCAAASRLLPKGGVFSLCFNPGRLVRLLGRLSAQGLTPKRLRLVHGRRHKPASLALLECMKGGGEELIVEPPLVVYGQGQNYTDEISAIYDRLCGP